MITLTLYYNCTFALCIFRLQRHNHVYAHYTSLLCFNCFALLSHFSYSCNFNGAIINSNKRFRLFPALSYRLIQPTGKVLEVKWGRFNSEAKRPQRNPLTANRIFEACANHTKIVGTHRRPSMPKFNHLNRPISVI